MAFKNIVFDVDGTLLDTYENNYQAKVKLLEELKIPYTKEQIEKGFSLTSENSLKLYGIDLNSELGKELVLKDGKYYDEFAHLAKLFPSTKETINYLKEHNIKLGIVTSRIRKEVMTEVHLQDIISLFDIIITASDIDKPKPDPESLELLFERTSWKKEETIFIGDSLNDSKCASSAKVAFGLAKWGSLENIPYQYIFSKIEDIKNII